MAGQTIAISVLADTKPFSKAMKSVGTGIGVAFAAGAVAVGAFVATSIKAAAESEKVAAQTDAVLKSTSQAAGRTAEQIGALTTELSRMAGVDDEVIQGGQNILLTFTKIKGDQFDAATEAALNLSVALGKDMASSATLVGKALNDPIAGVGALSKVGVQLTDEQKALVKQMTEVGDTAGAQAVILGVLEEQFGGSAAAFGNTFEGAISKVQTEFGNLQETLGSAFLPALTTVTNRVADFLAMIVDSPAFATFVSGLNNAIDALFSGEAMIDGLSFDGILEALVNAVTSAVDWLAAGGLASIFEGITAARAGFLDAAMAAFPGILDALIQIAPQLVAGVAAMVSQIVGFLAQSAGTILTGGIQLLTGLIAAVAKIAPPLITSIIAIIPEIVTSLVGLIPAILDAAIMLFTALVDAIPEIVPPLVAAIVATLPILITAILGMIPKILDGAIKLFTALIDAIPKILPLLINAIITLAPKLITSIISMLPKLLNAAVKLFTGIVSAIPKVLPQIVKTLIAMAPKLVSAIIGMIPKLVRAGVDLVGGLVRGLWSAASSVGQALVKIAQDAIGGFLSFLGIKSPSRLFASYGLNIGEGLARGLTSSEGIVSGALDGLATTVADFDATPSGAALAPVVRSDARQGAPLAIEPSPMSLDARSIEALARAIAFYSKDLVIPGVAIQRANYAENAASNARGRT